MTTNTAKQIRNAPPATHPTVEPPARVWMVPNNSDGSLWPKSVWNEPIPAASVELLAAAPIREALSNCNATSSMGLTGPNKVLVAKSDWDALVAIIKGDANGK